MHFIQKDGVVELNKYIYHRIIIKFKGKFDKSKGSFYNNPNFDTY